MYGLALYWSVQPSNIRQIDFTSFNRSLMWEWTATYTSSSAEVDKVVSEGKSIFGWTLRNKSTIPSLTTASKGIKSSQNHNAMSQLNSCDESADTAAPKEDASCFFKYPTILATLSCRAKMYWDSAHRLGRWEAAHFWYVTFSTSGLLAFKT